MLRIPYDKSGSKLFGGYMKNYYSKLLISLVITVFILLFLPGCSSTYVQEQFSSKEEFYSEINDDCSGRTVNVNFVGDTSTDGENTFVGNDSVYWNNLYELKGRQNIPLDSIKDISYKKIKLKEFDGILTLKNDSTYRVFNAVYGKNEILANVKVNHRFSEPIKAVSSISYDNHWKGMGKYGLAGLFAGALVGYKLGSDAGIRDRNPELGAIAGSFIFAVGGMLAGLIVGSQQVYYLHTEKEQNKFIHKIGLTAGMASSSLYGGFSDNRDFQTRAFNQYAFGIYYKYNITRIITFRPGIFYTQKGGNYSYRGEYYPSPYSFYNSWEKTSAVKLSTLEIPLLLRIGTASYWGTGVEALVGPAFNIFLNGRLEEYDIGPMDEAWKSSEKNIKAASYLSLMFGFGLKINSHSSIEFLYDKSFNSFGRIGMLGGAELNLKQDNFLIRTTYAL